MTRKLTCLTFALILLSANSFAEEIDEIVVLEKKLSSLSGWSNNCLLYTSPSPRD